MIRKLIVVLLSVTICLVGVAPSLAALQAWSTPQEYENATGKTIEGFNEAPMLRVQVAAGELPGVVQRLPQEPVVIEPYEEIGQYGGTAYTFSLEAGLPGDGSYIAQDPETVFNLTPDVKSVIPNIIKKWDFSTDGKTLTLHFREGMKWSDGAPYTADDLMFWWEDIIHNDELTPTVPTAGIFAGLTEVEKVDDYTVRWHYAAPLPHVLRLLAGPAGYGILRYPQHYLKEFHIKYNPEANELARDNGFDAWYQYLGNKLTCWTNMPTVLGTPSITAFRIVEKKANYLLFERNPYYWKVDTEGNQLPYIDKIMVTKLEDPEIYSGKIVGGEADFASRYATIANYPLYKESAEKAGYRVLLWPGGYGSKVIYFLNQTVKDPVLREAFQDVRFRRALSLAINREEINETLFYGLGTPRQWTLVSSSSIYEPRFGEAYAQYDPQEANRLLDEMGLEWDESNEYRLRSDGERLAWILEVSPDAPGGDIFVAMSELATEFWGDIGVQITVKPETAVRLLERNMANEVAMTAWVGDRGTDMAFFGGIEGAQWFNAGVYRTYASYGVEWAKWYDTEGKEGEEPPEEVKKIWAWMEELVVTMDEEKRIELGKKVLASQAENVWVIGTVGMSPQPLVVKNDLRNVPEEHLFTWDVLYTKDSYPVQFFLKQK